MRRMGSADFVEKRFWRNSAAVSIPRLLIRGLGDGCIWRIAIVPSGEYENLYSVSIAVCPICK